MEATRARVRSVTIHDGGFDWRDKDGNSGDVQGPYRVELCLMVTPDSTGGFNVRAGDEVQLCVVKRRGES